MSKQEEIRKGIENLRREAFGDCGSGYFTDALIKYLHDNDVVIKVDNGLYGHEAVGSGVKVESLINK